MERQKLIIITIVIFILIVVVIIAYLCVRSKDEFVDGDRALITNDSKNLNIIDKTTFNNLFFDQLYPPGSIYVGTGNFPGYPFNSSEWEKIDTKLLVGADGLVSTTNISEMLGYTNNYPIKFQEDGGGILALNKWKRKCDNCIPPQKQPMSTVSINDINNVKSVGWSTSISPNTGDKVLNNEGFWESAANTYNQKNSVTVGPLANYLICIQDGKPARIYGQYVTINFDRINYKKFYLKTGDKSSPNKIHIIAKLNEVCYWNILYSHTDIQVNNSYILDLPNTEEFNSYGILVVGCNDTNVRIEKLFFFNDLPINVSHINVRASSVSKNNGENSQLSDDGGFHPDFSADFNINKNVSGMLYYPDNTTISWQTGTAYNNNGDSNRYTKRFSSENSNNSGEFIKFDFDKKFILSKLNFSTTLIMGVQTSVAYPKNCSIYASNDQKVWTFLGRVGPWKTSATWEIGYVYNSFHDSFQITDVMLYLSPNAGSYQYYIFQINNTIGNNYVANTKFIFYS